MNIFLLDEDLDLCAEYHTDAHVISQIKEVAQMMSTNIRLINKVDIGNKITHQNHPCTVWMRESLSNYRYSRRYALALHRQWRMRWNHSSTEFHKSARVILSLPELNVPDIGLTPFAQAFDDKYKSSDAIQSYREYYRCEKTHLFKWKHNKRPYWL